MHVAQVDARDSVQSVEHLRVHLYTSSPNFVFTLQSLPQDTSALWPKHLMQSSVAGSMASPAITKL